MPIRRAQPVVDLLHDKGARKLKELHHRANGAMSLWSVGSGKTLILHEFGFEGRDGYEVYIPISDTNRTDDTLTALAAYAEKESR